MSASIVVPEPHQEEKKYPFIKCCDSRGRELRGLWRRNWRFYCQMQIPGKGSRRVPLLDEQGRPVETVAEAVKARNRLLADRDAGRTPGPSITPPFSDYYLHYISWLESTKAKSPLTIEKERSALKGWVRFLGTLRLNQITRKKINDYVVQRTARDNGVSNRTANLDVVALGNMLKFAKDEGWLKGELPTDNWKPLKYVAPRRSLLTWDQIQAICDEALAMNDGKPKYENGQFLADYIKLLAFSGARRQAALSLRWDQVDWSNRQLTLFTKFDKTVIVDMNEKLEAHLKELWSRRNQDSPWVFPSPRAAENGPGYFANPQKLLDEVKADAEMPDFRFHDLRHWFISSCAMAGIDALTIASWVGHSDGGKLIFSTYGHLNPQHKRDAAAKLQFTPQETTTQNPNLVTLDLSKMSASDLLGLLQRANMNLSQEHLNADWRPEKRETSTS
jgi:integrase